jgi:DNA topoisomerase-1
MPPKYNKYYKNKKYTEKQPDTLEIGSAKYLIIVESPSKCKKIEGFLGSQYKCIASKGHLREINGLKSINIKGNFEITFSHVAEKEAHIQFMKQIIQQFPSTNVYLATDDDREGEAISWHIAELFHLPIETTPRILFHEITQTAIETALQTPTRINMQLVYAQQARQVLDIIVGFKISPFLWKYLYNSKESSLSAGRCQTPALRLVYDNEKEKDRFSTETKYKTTAYFFSKNIGFALDHDFTDSTNMVDFLEKSKLFAHQLSIGSQKDSIKHAPTPLNTSRLLQVANNVLHLSPKQTMTYCQQLYQEGHITYMRTDSTKYSKEFLDKMKLYIETKWKPEYVGSLDKLENKDSQNPHEAIRVTHIEKSFITNEDAKLVSLYKLIWRTTVESCMKDAKYYLTQVFISAPDTHSYTYTIETPVFLGWKSVNIKKEDPDPACPTDIQNQDTGLLLYFQSIAQKGSPAIYNHIESVINVQKKHSHYTEASLIQKLEDLGIGRPSTFSSIVETIQDRGYVSRVNIEGSPVKCIEYKLKEKTIEIIEKEKVFGNEKNKLVIQPVGILTVEFLIAYFNELFSYEYTNQMETKLDIISNHNQNPTEPINWYDICKECYNDIRKQSKELKIEKQRYKINDEYDLVFEKFGPVLKKNTHMETEDGELIYEYKSIKKDISLDLEKLKRMEYTMDDLIEINHICLGNYKELPVDLKNGRYGPYIEWNGQKQSVKQIQKEFSDIKIEDVMFLLNPEEKDTEPSTNERTLATNKNILRIIDTDMSIRKGKFGAYIYYRTDKMSTAQFYNLNKFRKGYLSCELQILKDWIKETHGIP